MIMMQDDAQACYFFGKIAKPGGPRPDRLQNPVVRVRLQNPAVPSLQNPVVPSLQNPVVCTSCPISSAEGGRIICTCEHKSASSADCREHHSVIALIPRKPCVECVEPAEPALNVLNPALNPG